MSDFLTISGSAQSSLYGVKRTNDLLALTAKRISTGLRVSSPFEGVSAFFDASALTSQPAQLLTVKERINNAAVVTGGTITAIDSIIDVVNSMKAEATKANGVSTTVSGNTVTTASAVVTGAGIGAIDGDTFTVTHDGTTTTITNNNTETFTQLAAQVTAISGLTATVSDGNSLIITAVDGKDITIANGVNTLATNLGLSTSTNGTFITSAVREAAETEFDVLRGQISTLTGGATFLGTNLLASTPDTLTVKFGSSTNKLTITGVSSNATALSISAVDDAGSFATNAGVATTIAQLDAAIITLNATKATFTTNDTIIQSRLDFTESIIALSEENRTKLTGADLEAETATLLALQSRQQLALGGISILFSGPSSLVSLLQSK